MYYFEQFYLTCSLHASYMLGSLRGMLNCRSAVAASLST
jgi:hypothetical protein